MALPHLPGYLQVFSAICVVFAHGAGEVGYMAGPLATIWWVQWGALPDVTGRQGVTEGAWTNLWCWTFM
jgi:phosphate/sulfate permease